MPLEMIDCEVEDMQKQAKPLSLLPLALRLWLAQITNKPLLHRRNWLDSEARLKYTGAETHDEWRD